MADELLMVHGVATGSGSPYVLAWTTALKNAGLEVEGRPALWDARHGFGGDGIALADTNFRRTQLRAIEDHLSEFKKDGGKVVLAHSMGTALCMEVERELRSGLHYVLIGSPLTNPMLAPVLGAAQLVGVIDLDPAPIHIRNTDDPITGGMLAFKVPGVRDVPITVNGDAFGTVASEHAGRLYCAQPETVRAIRECLAA